MMWRTLPGLDLDHDPFREFRRFQREVGSLLNRTWEHVTAFPAVNVWANDEEVVVTAEVPGVDPKAIKLTVTGDVLQVEGERRPKSVATDESPDGAEEEVETFSRSVHLPFEVDNDQITARAEHGILTVTLPRAEAAKPKTITIETK